MSLSNEDAQINPLREALRFSPENIPLRRHLAATLLRLGRPEEAEEEYKQALRHAPQDAESLTGLAEAYLTQGKLKPALMVTEQLANHPDADAGACLLHARTLLRNGRRDEATQSYRKARVLDPLASSPELDDAIGRLTASSPEVSGGRIRDRAEESVEIPETEVDRPKTNFSDVGGMEALKEEIRLKIIYPLNNKELYAAYGKSIGGGILMYGPPGCGKTHLARATAGEIRAGFISVGLHDVLDMWVGQSEQKLHQIFEQARRNAPCVLFFDEVDALGANRRDLRQSAGRQLINQFLSELDGVNTSNDGLLILAATNAPWHLDPAFRRTGRFDRLLFVPTPDEEARAAILQILLKGKPQERLDFRSCAKKMKDFSGADLKGVVDIAIEGKLQEAMRTGIPAPITDRDLQAAARKVTPCAAEWYATAKNYALFSNEGGVYNDILRYLGIK